MKVAFLVNDLQLSGGVGVVVAHARQLVEHHGFTIVAVEADWPDAATVDLGGLDLVASSATNKVRSAPPGPRRPRASPRSPSQRGRSRHCRQHRSPSPRRPRRTKSPRRRSGTHGSTRAGHWPTPRRSAVFDVFGTESSLADAVMR